MTYIKLEDAVKAVEALYVDQSIYDEHICSGDVVQALRSLPTDDGVTDEMVERVAQAIAGDLNRQDFIQEQDCINPLGPSLSWSYLDQGEVNFAQVARAALEAALGPLPAPPAC